MADLVKARVTRARHSVRGKTFHPGDEVMVTESSLKAFSDRLERIEEEAEPTEAKKESKKAPATPPPPTKKD